jgi:hypothetical protein
MENKEKKTFSTKRFVVEVRELKNKSLVVQMLRDEDHRTIDCALTSFIIVNSDRSIDKKKYGPYALVHEQEM